MYLCLLKKHQPMGYCTEFRTKIQVHFIKNPCKLKIYVIMSQAILTTATFFAICFLTIPCKEDFLYE